MKSRSTEELKSDVKGKILTFLSLKPRTVGEVSDRLYKYLSKKEYSLDSKHKKIIQDELLDELKNLNLLDDSKYAKLYVSQQVRSGKPVNKYKLQTFLLKKKVGNEIIREALGEVSVNDEIESATLLCEKKLRSLSRYTQFEQKKKLYMFLKSKGFNSEIIRTVVDNTLGVK